MSGGQLVVLDRLGRDVKRYPLAQGLVTLGSDHSCDIRFMLDTVSPHHATVAVHANQTVVRNVCGGETLVNGAAVSVAALQHGDVISIGGRRLRWHYADPTVTRAQAPLPALHRATGGGGRGARRGSGPAQAARRDPQLRLALELAHRASMPANAGGKQVAIVQPQRRDTNNQNDKPPPRTPQSNKRSRSSKNELDVSVTDEADKSKRKSSGRASNKADATTLQNTTKATLWIESRKSSPRKASKTQTPPRSYNVRRTASSAKKSTPLRLTVLKRAQSAHKVRVTKIEEPLRIDHTKQAAILLMTGHTPKTKLLGQKTPSPTASTNRLSGTPKSACPKSASPKSAGLKPGGRRSASFVIKKKSPVPRTSTRTSRANGTISILEITDSVGRNSTRSTLRDTSRRSTRTTSDKSVELPSPRKSALKDPTVKRSARKTESIKFDLSNLDNYSQQSDALTVEEDTLRYSTSPPSRASLRTTRQLDSYSIVDLVSRDSLSSHSTSVYGSLPSSDTSFATPRSMTRTTRSSVSSSLLTSSTPYVKSTKTTKRSRSTPDVSSRASRSLSRSTLNVSTRSPRPSSITKTSISSRASETITTPENSVSIVKNVTVNSTKISRASRSKSRYSDTDLVLVESSQADDSPRSSKKSTSNRRSSSAPVRTRGSNISTLLATPSDQGTNTPENQNSPDEATTPVLSIQSLLDSSQNSLPSRGSKSKGRPSLKRKTIGVPSKTTEKINVKSRSASFTLRKTRQRLSNDSYENMNVTVEQEGEVVTPKSAVKLVQEAVKNKHSTAKKPLSKRSIIDDLNESDIVKQLFNSPVKRKLSQSMTEFSRKQLFEDDDVIVQAKRPTRNTIEVSARSPDVSLLQQSHPYTPDRFVSPLSSAGNSPDLNNIKLLYKKTPENDLRNVRGVRTLLRTPRARKSIKNDLTDVAGVKAVFAKSPRNRLSNVRVKEIFNLLPDNDLRRVSGVKALFQRPEEARSPRNSLSDVRGVKKLFSRKSPANDLNNISGVKRLMNRRSPKNELRDVRGVKRMFARQRDPGLHELSGVQLLFDEHTADSQFDALVGKPTLRAVYSKTFDSRSAQKKSTRKTVSLHSSPLVTRDNVEAWLEEELARRVRQSAAQYSARKLPLKKRSLADSADSADSTTLLPIKKRPVLHSTPLKGRAQLSTSVELGRVSPIVPDTHASYRASENTIDARKSRRGTRGLPKSPQHLILSTKQTGRLTKGTPAKPTPAKKSAKEIGSNETFTFSPAKTATSAKKLRRSATESVISTKKSISPSSKRASNKLESPTQKITLVTEARSPKKSVHGTPKVTVLKSPAKTRASSAKTSISPRKSRSAKKSASPTKTPNSSAKKTVSAKKLTNSASRSSRSSKIQLTPSNKSANSKKTKTPARTPVSSKKATSPAKKSLTPAKPLASPAKTPGTPGKRAPNLAKKSVTPAKKTSPTKKTVSPVKVPTSPIKKTRASKKPISSVKKITKKLQSPNNKPLSPATPKQATPKPTRSRRTAATVTQTETNTKKRGAALVVSKKSSVMSPQPKVTRKRKETSPLKPNSPKKTRTTRNKQEQAVEKPKTPKTTRAKVLKTTVAVVKPSPQLKPRSTRGRASQKVSEHIESPKKKSQEPKKSAKQAKSSRKINIASDQSEVSSADVSSVGTTSRRGRSTKTAEPAVSRSKRGGRIEPEPQVKSKKVEKEVTPVKQTKKTRGKTVVQERIPETNTRSRRGAPAPATPTAKSAPLNSRKRKSTATNDRPAKLSKSKHQPESKTRNKKIESPKTNKTVKKNVAKESLKTENVKVSKGKKEDSATKKTTRSRKNDVSVEVPKETKRATRAKQDIVVAESEVGKRKRKPAIESPPGQASSKKARDAAGTPPSRSTRSVAAVATASKPGRSRRR